MAGSSPTRFTHCGNVLLLSRGRLALSRCATSGDRPAVSHGLEALEALQDDNRTGFAVIAVPAAQPRAHPGGVGQGTGRVRVLLLLGFAFESGTDRRQRGQVLWI